MKSKLLFTAALMSAMAGTAQVTWVDVRGVNGVEDSRAMSMDEGTELPEPLVFYDFQSGTEDCYELKNFGNGTKPEFSMASATEQCLDFTASDTQSMGYVQIANPFKGKTLANGATISLWVYRTGTADNSIWGFGLGADGYEDQNKSGMLGFQANTYMVYNMAKIGGPWIDFNGSPGGSLSNAIPAGRFAMITMVFAKDGCTFYVDGKKVEYGPSNSSADPSTLYQGILENISNHFTHFYVGKGTFTGTFEGKADKLGLYDKALTAEEVFVLYESQKTNFGEEQDMTSKIINPDFSNGVDGWDTGGAPFDEGRLNNLGLVFVSINRWSYGKTFDFSQTLNELPSGVYQLSAQVSSSTGNSEVLCVTGSWGEYSEVGFGNSGLSVEDAAKKWSEDKEANRVFTAPILVTDGQLRIVLRRHNQRDGDVFFDNFRLEKVGSGMIEVKELYDDMKEKVQAMDVSGLPETFKERRAEALAKEPEQTVDGWAEAYLALKQVYEVCHCYMTDCPIAALVEICKEYKQNSEASDEIESAFAAAIADAEKASCDTEEELRTAYDALENVRRAFVQSATPMGEQQFDMTFMLKNPDVSGFNSWSAVEGWSGDDAHVAGWGIRAQHNIAQTGETSSDAFFECYADGVLPDGLWAIYQTVNLSSGFYTMRLATFAGPVNNVPGTGEAKAALYAGEKRGDEVKSTTLAYHEVSFCQSTEGEVRLGVKTEEGNLANWIGCNDMKLYKVAPRAEALALDETGAYDVKADMYADVTLQRKLVAEKWNTFCVPFALTAEQVEANKLGEVRRLSGMQASGEGITLDFDKVDAVEAGVPYLVKPEEVVTEIKADGVMVSAKQPEAFPMNLVSMTGNYGATHVPQGAYFINDDMFYLADQADKVSLKGFRAYINVDSESPVAGVNRLLIDIDGSVTSVGEVLDNTAEDGGKMVDVFTLSGVKVKAGVKKAEALCGLERGIYIVGGKKVIK
ncbi:LamG-like jellyroll fold domain-containing protein [Paraprevotella clara]|uniref:LamG-like jellyroll fold domain-containing protein n=1 Tax=Paraprevotella clara TaxID=454154 RepID=UPI004024C66B